jgi:hypothetical protein
MTMLFGTGYVGLRALATGLPAWYLLNPRSATAQSLTCAITAKTNLQYLVVSTSSMGDPINCNCPGTYEKSDVVHPAQSEVAKISMTDFPALTGGNPYGAATPWAATTAGGALDVSVLQRISFFHHTTGTTVHGDQPKVMKLLGSVANGDMLVSAFARHLAPCFGTVQTEPVAVGAGGNASEFVSYSGRMLPAVSPMQLKQLLTPSSNNPLVNLRSIRDTALDQLNALAKSDATGVQQQFLDALSTTQSQVRALATQLGSTLSSIKDNGVQSQGLAAAALIAANVTPVVTMHIPFGGDNHTDQNLQTEADQTVSGVQGIQQLMAALSSNSLTDKVTFATLNVFGRNLNGIAKVTSLAGRDHYGNHCVTVMIGKNVKPSVIGGITPDSSGAYMASGIDSSTGNASTSGDITADQTHVSAARTLAGALGIPASVANSDFISSAGGALVPAALVTVPS